MDKVIIFDTTLRDGEQADRVVQTRFHIMFWVSFICSKDPPDRQLTTPISGKDPILWTLFPVSAA